MAVVERDFEWALEKLACAVRTWYQGKLNIQFDWDRTPTPPSAVIVPDTPNVEYGQSFGNGVNVWNVEILVIPGAVAGKSQELRVGKLISPRSTLINAIRTADYDGGSVLLRRATMATTKLGPAMHRCARLQVTVRA